MQVAFLAEVRVKDGVADPEGLAIERALPALGFAGVGEVSVGKAIRFVVEAGDEQAARLTAERLCEALLANTVIERYELSVLGGAPAAGRPSP
ncbi:MAG TPA: phosphoribosylformylglycinamidine synthase subunit PurS [Acidimicrobiales bacterium]|nr:phosphoribosylformylglycinamidine synthase subunit PurS [Acidimicrobiales bacterium]